MFNSDHGQFPTDTNYKMIAPYWADVDTRGIANVTYRMTTDADLLRRANNHIRKAFPPKRFRETISSFQPGFYDTQTEKVRTIGTIRVFS